MKKIRLTATACLLFLIMSVSAYAQSLKDTLFMTEILPPYNYIKNGTLQGAGIEILRESLAAVDVHINTKDIKIYPRARTGKMLLSIPNSCSLTIRTAKNDSLFKWAGPIADYSCSFITKKKKPKTRTLEGLTGRQIGVIRGSITHEYLKPHNYMLTPTSSLTQLILKLSRNRAESIFSNKVIVFSEMKNLNINTADYVAISTVNIGELYFAFNINTDDAVVDKLRKGISIIRAEGKLDRILGDISY